MATSYPDILIAGASARAAACSAIRGGLRVAATDLFADRDLAAVADASVVASWPGAIERWAAQFPSSVPLVYTGGLENHPELLERMSRSRPIAGVYGDPLRIVRSPERLFDLMAANDIPIAPLGSTIVDASKRWLIKPRKGGGGRGIRFLGRGGPATSPDEYIQEYVAGEAGSAAFLATSDGRVELIGMCEALQGPKSDANPFGYSGSIIRRDWTSSTVERAARILATIGLRGLFGIDVIRRTDAECVLLEVNPRFTASMELHELAQGRSLVAEHLASFHAIGQPTPALENRSNEAIFGKRIVYAPRDLTCDLEQLPSRTQILAADYNMADIPERRSVIAAHTPICTVIARADSVESCRSELERREKDVLAKCEVLSK